MSLESSLATLNKILLIVDKVIDFSIQMLKQFIK